VQGALSASDEELVFYEESGGPAKDDFFQGTGCNSAPTPATRTGSASMSSSS